VVVTPCPPDALSPALPFGAAMASYEERDVPCRPPAVSSGPPRTLRRLRGLLTTTGTTASFFETMGRLLDRDVSRPERQLLSHRHNDDPPEAALKASGHVDHFTDILATCTRCGESYRGDQLLEAATHEEQEGLTTGEIDARILELKIDVRICKGVLGPSREFHMMSPWSRADGKGSRLPSTGDGPGSVPEPSNGSSRLLRRKLPMGLAIVGRAYRTRSVRGRARTGCGNSSKPSCRSSSIPRTFAGTCLSKTSRPSRSGWRGLEKHAPTAHDIPRRISSATDSLRGMLPPVQVQRFYLDLLRLPRDASDSRSSMKKNGRSTNDQTSTSKSGKRPRGIQGGRRGPLPDGPDLKGHERVPCKTVRDLRRVETRPHVLELSFGVDRNVWALLDLSYTQGDRVVLRLPARSRRSPVAASSPLLNKDGLPERAEALYAELRKGITASTTIPVPSGDDTADDESARRHRDHRHETLEGRASPLRERDRRNRFRVKEGPRSPP